MIKLILKLGFLFAIVLAVGIIIKKFIYKPLHPLPWSFVSDQIFLKSSYYDNHKQSINCVFIGSSIVRRGFNPEVFDSICAKDKSTRSFNFGINWMGMPETVYLVEKIALQENTNLDYLFIELTKLKVIDYENMHTSRSIYWYDYDRYLFTMNAFAEAPSGILKKGAAFLSHTTGYLENLVNLGYWNDINEFELRSNRIADSLEVLEGRFNGFAGLEGAALLYNEPDREEDVSAAVKRFLADTSGLVRRKQYASEAFDRVEKDADFRDDVNPVYSGYVSNLIDTLMRLGIYPVFVLSPKADRSQYLEVLPVFYSIDPAHRIDIADSRKFPELYSVALAGDETHLNTGGARRYTEILAGEFLRITASAGNKINH